MYPHSVLSYLTSLLKPKRYLEVGVGNGKNLKAIKAREKVGIDIKKPNLDTGAKIYLGKSDDIFENFNEKPFDLIFIDAYHEFNQAVRDLKNSIKYLSNKGVIVCHDVWPFNRINHYPYPIIGKKPYKMNPDGTWHVAWCGDLWKLPLYVKYHLPDFNYAVIDTFPGWLIIWREKREINEKMTVKQIDQLNNTYPLDNKIDFNFQGLNRVLEILKKCLATES